MFYSLNCRYPSETICSSHNNPPSHKTVKKNMGESACVRSHNIAQWVGCERRAGCPAPSPPRCRFPWSMHGSAEGGSAVHAGIPLVLLDQATRCAYLTEHRYPWFVCVHEHTLTPIIDLKPSLAGWACRWTGVIAFFSFPAEGADHWFALVSALIVGRAL